jgi:hypothetical protein
VMKCSWDELSISGTSPLRPFLYSGDCFAPFIMTCLLWEFAFINPTWVAQRPPSSGLRLSPNRTRDTVSDVF